MDYFKHYSTASDSKLVNHLFDEYGHKGYAYWFLLLELCAENWDGKSDPCFKFHTRIVRQKLRISLGKLEHFLRKSSSFCNVSFQLSETELEIEIPKLAEVKTSRSVIKSNKKQLTVYIDKDIDKDKDKDKEKVSPSAFPVLDESTPKITQKIKSPSTSKKQNQSTVLFEIEPPQNNEEIPVDQKASNVLTMFNALTFSGLRPLPGNMKHINARLKEGYELEDFKAVIQHKYAQWVNNPKFAHCIRPQTFFSQNFDAYLQKSKNALKPKLDPLDEFLAPYYEKMRNEA